MPVSIEEAIEFSICNSPEPFEISFVDGFVGSCRIVFVCHVIHLSANLLALDADLLPIAAPDPLIHEDREDVRRRSEVLHRDGVLQRHQRQRSSTCARGT